MAQVTPMISTQPATSETQMEFTIPLGPEIDAVLVSSVMCAEASYPVKVYCAMSNPIRTTYRLEWNPVWLTNLVKTKLPVAWCVGTKASTATMTTTPMTCHHTLTSERKATTWTPKVFNRA